MQTPCPQPACATPAFSGDVGEGSVAIVFEEMRSRFLSPAGNPSKTRTIHQKNVQPAVVVVVVKRDAAAGGLEQIFVFVLAAEDGFGVEAGRAPDIDKGCTD